MVRELTELEVWEVLRRESSARLCFSGDGHPAVITVTYRTDGGDELHLGRSLAEAAGLSRAGALVCLEVDRFHGPARWETVVGWGELRGTPAAGGVPAYRLQLSRIRGFGCTPDRSVTARQRAG